MNGWMKERGGLIDVCVVKDGGVVAKAKRGLLKVVSGG